MSEYRGCPYCNHMEPFRHAPTRCGNCGGLMIPDVEEIGDEQCVSWMPDPEEIDREKSEQKQSGEYRPEDWDE